MALSMIQALIPLGLRAVEAALQAEVTALAGARYAPHRATEPCEPTRVLNAGAERGLKPLRQAASLCRRQAFCRSASASMCLSSVRSIDRQGANLFFQLGSRRYERGAILLTSNQSLGA